MLVTRNLPNGSGLQRILGRAMGTILLHYSNPCNQPGCTHITAVVGFDLPNAHPFGRLAQPQCDHNTKSAFHHQWYIPNSRATPKRGSPYPQLEGPHRSVRLYIPNSRATQLCGFMSPYPQLKGPPKICGFQVCGQNPAFEMGFLKHIPVLTNPPPPILTVKPLKPYQKTPQSLPKNVSYQKKIPQT